MSFSAISSNAPTQTNLLQSLLQQSRAQFQKLAQDLQSGNLAAAQQNFSQLTQNASSSRSASSPVSGSTTASLPATATLQINQDLSTLASSLQSGNLSGAQKAYASLQQDLQASNSTRQVHHHHHHAVSESAQSSTPSANSGANTGPSSFSLNSILGNISAVPLAGLSLTA
jgi:outer membrane protein assembly factor BamD (BamD/ComL family)